MNQNQLDTLFLNGILVDSSIKDAEVQDFDDLLAKLKERKISFLDSGVLNALYDGEQSNSDCYVEVIKNYEGETSSGKPADWVAYFNDRFNRLRDLLLLKDNSGITSISNIKSMPQGADIKTIAMLSNISISPIKKYTVFDMEDNTGSYRGILTSQNSDLLADQVVLIKGRKFKDAVFIKDIVYPDIQVRDSKPKDIEDSYVLFLSDIHVGSKLFAKDAAELFMKWINQEVSEYSSIAKLVKFIVISGDLVDGIGVYPNQEKELEIKDLREQYEAFYKLFDRIPKNIKLLISQGNHDATHIAEPQPKPDPNFASPVYKLVNAVFLSNPYQVNLVVGSSKTNLLSYHGFSIPYYADTISKYNKMDPQDIEEIMKLHLKSRHLAPTHGSSQVVPLKRDYLVIDETPDIYATGHIHKALVSKYKETILINSSCWQYQTSYQKKYGMNPDIAKVPIVNLRDKSYMMLDFLGEKVQAVKP